jgi:hypothetical protein
VRRRNVGWLALGVVGSLVATTAVHGLLGGDDGPQGADRTEVMWIIGSIQGTSTAAETVESIENQVLLATFVVLVGRP